MAQSTNERQRAFRHGQIDKLARRKAALMQIIARLDGNDKPLAVEIRQLAQDGLTGS